MPLTPAEAAAHLLAIRAAQSSFLGFVRLMHPEWDLQPHHLEIIETLDLLEKGELRNPAGELITRIMVNMPPRHGKSALITTLFVVYYLSRHPTRHVLSSSYADALAKKFGNDIRGYLERPELRQAYPDLALRADARAKNEWSTTSGGSYYGVGIGGSTTGKPANLLLIDDPVKNRTEAESATYRDRVWDMYVGSLANRKEPSNDDGSVPIEIVVMTRWHPDDLGGRLQASPEWAGGLWHHLRQPALTELADGTLRALWPERFPVSELLLHKQRSGRDFEALYQQNPVVQGGNLIKSDWWQRYDPNEYADHAYQSLIIAADTAFKKTEQADFSVFLIAGLTAGGDIHLLDLLRLKLEFPELKRRAISLNALWRGRGLRGLYIEDKASGQSLIQELKTQSGISVIAHKVVNDKVARVNAVLPLIEGGRVFLPSFAPWLEAFEEECGQFPASAHDDQVDALSLALDVLSRQTVMPGAMAFDPTRSLNSQGWAVAQAMHQPLHKDPFQWGSLNSPTLPKALGDF
ncbi:hypothetical protein TSH7_10005 [Azospirillum sp. TSH7]|uniref:phage terminase large subunit n=1 Tax=unclassified Azospirillum TaxID=2630922 RepID=UPI000D61A1D2|nr:MULTISPECIES: phage terminase large subunit [unclassified Azospirillum]PWC64001.1 hypothetical protein TSH20_19100 [Azospirillum sp. TSH20]PWC64864.1 hypothetical protein TSH7_10005 [Azospirillum sp. TSH7]